MVIHNISYHGFVSHTLYEKMCIQASTSVQVLIVTEQQDMSLGHAPCITSGAVRGTFSTVVEPNESSICAVASPVTLHATESATRSA
jgi:hypothetical protein